MNTSKAQPVTNPKNPVAIIILAAGHGTRMKSDTPKVLHKLAGLPMLGHVITCAESLNPERMAVVIGDHAPHVGDAAKQMRADVEVFVQAPPRGTGDAVKQALPALKGFSGTTLVLYADTPLIKPETLMALACSVEAGHAVSVLGFRPSLEHAYGRLVLGPNDMLEKIVEHRDATQEERTIDLCNSGVMAFNNDFLLNAVPNITNDNAKGEYYLTDMVAIARAEDLPCSATEVIETEVMGVDARTDLAVAENIWQNARRTQAMQDGATLADPSTVYFSFDTKIGKDVTIGQHVVFGPGVSVADHTEIKPFSHLEGASLASGVAAGPFARLRPGAQLGENVKVGNFVEIKKSVIEKGAKISHLSYIGDADLGEEVNIGAGTITCNYDGFEKFRTVIKKGSFIGSNSSLVAPVTIGEGAYVGSGSVITKDVDNNALAVARGRQALIKEWASRFRQKKKK